MSWLKCWKENIVVVLYCDGAIVDAGWAVAYIESCSFVRAILLKDGDPRGDIALNGDSA